MDIEKYLTLLNDEINKNANGHLSLNSRVQLMRKINSSNIVNKICLLYTSDAADEL